MGAVNVGAVLRTWHDLPHRARVVLLAMAHMALDTPRDGMPARRYFGGPGYLAEVLYGPDGVERLDGGEPVPTTSAGRQVEKALTELVRAGAVRRVTVGGRGHRSEYEVVLTPPVSPTDSVGVSPTESVAQPDRFGRPSPTETVGPRSHEEPRGTPGGQPHSSAPQRDAHATAVDDEQGWSDVVLVDDVASAEQYPAATAWLERTLGVDKAAAQVAYVVDTLGLSYTRAVVRVAADRGWKP